MLAPVLRFIPPPVKLIVAPVLLLRLTPVPVPVTVPESDTVPPFLLTILTERAAVLLIVPLQEIVRLPPSMLNELPVRAAQRAAAQDDRAATPTRVTLLAPPTR